MLGANQSHDERLNSVQTQKTNSQTVFLIIKAVSKRSAMKLQIKALAETDLWNMCPFTKQLFWLAPCFLPHKWSIVQGFFFLNYQKHPTVESNCITPNKDSI